MAVFQITFFLRYQKWGWSYQFFKTLTGDDPTIYSPSADFMLALKSCHSNYVVLERMRVTNMDKPRMSAVKDFQATFGTFFEDVALPNYSLNVHYAGQNGARRTLELRGVPQSWPVIHSITGQSDPPAIAFSKINSLTANIIGLGGGPEAFEIRQIDPVSTNPNRHVTVLKESINAPGFLAFATSPDLAASTGNSVKFGKISEDDFPGLNSIRKIINVTGTTYTVNYPWRQGDSEVFYPENGTVRVVSYSQRLITSRTKVEVRSRDTGRPINLSRGRSSGALRHR